MQKVQYLNERLLSTAGIFSIINQYEIENSLAVIDEYTENSELCSNDKIIPIIKTQISNLRNFVKKKSYSYKKLIDLGDSLKMKCSNCLLENNIKKNINIIFNPIYGSKGEWPDKFKLVQWPDYFINKIIDLAIINPIKIIIKEYNEKDTNENIEIHINGFGGSPSHSKDIHITFWCNDLYYNNDRYLQIINKQYPFEDEQNNMNFRFLKAFLRKAGGNIYLRNDENGFGVITIRLPIEYPNIETFDSEPKRIY
jgi:hypothetical protein